MSRKLPVIKDAECSKCIGSCCSAIYAPQWIGEEQVGKYSVLLGITIGEVKKKYVKPNVDGWGGYTTRVINNMCSFFKDGCMVDTYKPYECREYKMNGKAHGNNECRRLFVSKDGRTTKDYDPMSIIRRFKKHNPYDKTIPRALKIVKLLDSKRK